jgi:hypothetical protein
MSDHLLYLDGIDGPSVYWQMTCEHDAGDPLWATCDRDGYIIDDACWLWSWWDEVGIDLVRIDGPITVLPVPVRPSDGWDYDNGGSLVWDVQR